MEYEYPFRPRGKRGFDRDDVINYITQAQLSCNEHLARMEELETAKNAWYTQAKSLEREKAALVARNRELEELQQTPSDRFQFKQPGGLAFPQEQELAALKTRCLDLEQTLAAERNALAAEKDALSAEREKSAILETELQNLRNAQLETAQEAAPGSRPQEQEFAALEARCLGLETDLAAERTITAGQVNELQSAQADLQILRNERQSLLDQQSMGAQEFQLRIRELEQARYVLENERAELSNRVAILESDNAQLTQTASEANSNLPALAEAREECTALRQKIALLEEDLASLENECTQFGEALASCERERDALTAAKAEYEANLPALQDQLAQLTQSADQIGSLNEERDALNAQLAAARELDGTLAEQNALLAEHVEQLQLQLDALTRANAELIHKETLALQDAAQAAEDVQSLQEKLAELESVSAQQNSETLRSMVLASFNYSDLYVDNNLKTAQVISDTTSQNINRVNDSAGSLLDQVEAISRSFNDATDTIRRNLATFQRELSGIQSGLNRRLSKDRFSALLEENERLRTRMEQELLEELEADNGLPFERPADMQEPTQLPFAEDLPPSYHSFLDDE